jgi:hypothetical protein
VSTEFADDPAESGIADNEGLQEQVGRRDWQPGAFGPQVIAIPGTTSLTQLESSARAADITLTPDEWEGLRELGVRVRLIYPRRQIKALVAWVLGF